MICSLRTVGISTCKPTFLPAIPTSSRKDKNPQKAFFHLQTMQLHHVAHYHSMTLRSHKNTYLTLFNWYCGPRLLANSLAAIDLAKRPASPQGGGGEESEPSCLSLLALKSSKELHGELEVKRAHDVRGANVVHIQALP